MGRRSAFQTADAIFLPLVARQVTVATAAGRQRVTNDTLLLVADAYLSVLRARRRIARVNETLEFLTSEQPAPSRAGSKGMLPLVRDVVELGGKEALRSTWPAYKWKSCVAKRSWPGPCRIGTWLPLNWPGCCASIRKRH